MCEAEKESEGVRVRERERLVGDINYDAKVLLQEERETPVNAI